MLFQDVDLITNNCLEYNPDVDHFDKFIRNRACEMRDVAHGLAYDVLDPEFEKVGFLLTVFYLLLLNLSNNVE